MPQDPLTERALAIAGVLQAAQLVHESAHGGEPQENLFRGSVHSLFIFQPRDAVEVYGGLQGVMGGLECMTEIHNHGPGRRPDELRYGFEMVRVERHLNRYEEMLPVLRKRLETIREREDFAEQSLTALCSDVNLVYLDTLSKLEHRIHLQGSKHYLGDAQVQARIRTLLMAGVRSVMLWRQLGGNILNLFLQRQKILQAAAHLAQQENAS